MYTNGSPPQTKTGGSSSNGRNGGSSSGGGGSSSSSGSKKKSLNKKKSRWGARERAGMSFLIVIAFFAVFGLIIFTEILMIDDRNGGRSPGVIVRHVNVNNRYGESIPDYEDVKDDYADDSGIFVRETKYGSAALKSILKNQKSSSNFGVQQNDKLANPIGGSAGSISSQSDVLAAIPWGQMLASNIEETLPPYPGHTKPTDGSWQIVNGTRYKFFVFSAYYDRRDGKMIRVIGATKTRGPERVWCRLWYPMGANSTKYRSASVMARVKVIRENWNLKYSACFILCPIRGPLVDIPYSVSIVSKIRTPPGNVLLLRNTDSDTDLVNRSVSKIPDKTAICVKPLHFNYDQALHLLEFIELNGILGVSHFTLYNHTIGPQASCVLKHYMNNWIPTKLTATSLAYSAATAGDAAAAGAGTAAQSQPSSQMGAMSATSSTMSNSISHNNPTAMNKDNIINRAKITVDLLPWNLRMRSQKEIRTEGLFASLNDCLYRSMYRYSHVALLDFDEFIIPRHNETLTELLSWLPKRFKKRNTGAYSFQNAFFYLQFGDDPLMYKEKSSNPSLRSALITQKKTRRRLKLHPQKQRSKYICKPEAVIEAGNHFVWEFCPGRGSLNVPSDSAILHHYRVCEFGGDDCIKSPSTLDRTAHKYTEKLLQRVGAIYEYLKGPCNLPDLPAPPTPPPSTKLERLRKKFLKSKLISNNTLPTKP